MNIGVKGNSKLCNLYKINCVWKYQAKFLEANNVAR